MGDRGQAPDICLGQRSRSCRTPERVVVSGAGEIVRARRCRGCEDVKLSGRGERARG